jgi:hypothetical protein
VIAQTGVVFNSVIEKNLDGENPVIQSQVSGLNDHTIENMCFPGIEFNPAKGEKLVFIPIDGSDSFMVAIGGTNDKIAPDTLKGERRIFSVSVEGDELKAYAKFKNDGIIELNGNDNFAVMFNELKTAFDQLQSDHDALVNLHNAHIHITTATVGLSPVGLISPTTSLGTPSTADISPSKSENVLLKSNP